MTEQTATDSAPSAEERLAALFTAPEEDKADTEADSQADADEADAEAEVAGDEGEDDAADSEEAEDGQTEDEEGEADPEDEADDAESDDKADVKEPEFLEIDGEKVSLEEVKLGYLRQADYTRKTQAVAEQRKAADEDRQFVASALNSVLSAVGADVSRWEGVDWERAAVENPEQYKQAKAAYEHSLSLFNGVRAETEEFVKRAKQAQDEALKAQAKESVAILRTTIPNWSNDLYAQIGEFAVDELGFKPEEFNNIADYRAITSIYEAMQYRKGKTVATKKTLQVAPKKTLSDKKASSSKTESTLKTNQKARERLKETGKVDDAVALLVNRMR